MHTDIGEKVVVKSKVVTNIKMKDLIFTKEEIENEKRRS